MTNYCSYKDCQNVQRSFSSKTFFNLPTDARRAVWIKNSGNEKLTNIDASLRRVFCEDHFDQKDLRRQFNRTILRRDAVPHPYGESLGLQEIEFIEMAESDEEEEPENVKVLAESTPENSKIILLNKSPNVRVHLNKSNKRRISDSSTRPNQRLPEIPMSANSSEDTHVRLPNDSCKPNASVHESNDEEEEVDFIVLEENSQEPNENAADENEQSFNKKMRLHIENTTNQTSQRTDAIQSNSPEQQKLSAIVARSCVDGIVSSSETVDANNEETYFALSLVGILKRLPAHKRAIAKCHILSYLTELEYGTSSLS